MISPYPPALLEVDQESWNAQVDRVQTWLATTQVLQTTYRKLLESTVDGVAEPHVRSYLDEVLEVAHRHEAAVDDLHRAFGREPAEHEGLRTAAATVMARTRQAIGHVEGLASGARSPSWRLLRELLLSNLDSIAGFAVSEQLGLALGVPAVVDITLPVVRRKTQDQLLLQEFLLEMASNAILRGKDF